MKQQYDNANDNKKQPNVGYIPMGMNQISFKEKKYIVTTHMDHNYCVRDLYRVTNCINPAVQKYIDFHNQPGSKRKFC